MILISIIHLQIHDVIKLSNMSTNSERERPWKLPGILLAASGNCLPWVLSTAVFGNDSHHKEICIRITCELAVNKQKYLSPDYVVKGACLELTVKRLCHSTTSQRDLKQAYKLEVMASATDSKQVGPWQILAAANVLHRQIRSVYPNLGSSVVQREVNSVLMFYIDRYTVYPNLGSSIVQREVNRVFYCDHATSELQPANFPIWIMWSSNREDLENVNPIFWMASPFVPPVKEGEMREQDTDDDILNQGFCEAPLPKVGDFIITSFRIGRRLVQYHALLWPETLPGDDGVELQEREFVVKYLRNSGSSFVFPVWDDISVVSVQNLVEMLPLPMTDNRGCHFFTS